eukprot:scaffold77936_cov37-Attheya_sp.AAC.1
MPSAQRVVGRGGPFPAGPGARVSEEETFVRQMEQQIDPSPRSLVAAPGNALSPGQQAQKRQQQQQQQQQQQHTPQRQLITKKKPHFTPVDGRGMWANWMRSFKTPILACFDLLDNAFDAAMGTGGRVDITRLPDTGGVVIINNSHSPVKAIEEVCKIYKSEKGKSHSTIGENGVGLKQGCAALADVSLVLVKNAEVQLPNADGDVENQTMLSLAIIARCLQEEEGCRVPSFSFMIDDEEETPQLTRDIMQELNSISLDDPDAAACICTFGIHRLADLFVSILSNSWKNEPHIFCLALTNLKHGAELSESDNEESSSDDENSVNNHAEVKMKRYNTRKIKPSTSLLQDLARVLPINYIHVPRDVTVRIDEKPIRFSYWPRRLVELSKFTVHVDKTRNLHEYKNSDISWQTTGYPLNIYAGFDCLRLGEKQLGANSACRLYIYSRQCGRLITLVNDARHLLKLSSGGTDFAQGLTIIVDDSAGHLPLTPSKQDIAFSEERGAAAHEGNFYAWIGAVAKMFWHFHADKFGNSNKKTLLTAAVEEHREAIEAELLAENTFIMSLETAALTRFENMPWTKRTMGTTDATITKVAFNKRPKGGPIPPETFYIPGVATKFKFESNQARINANVAAAAAAAALKAARKPKKNKRKRISQISESKADGPSNILNGHTSPSRNDNRLKAQLMSSVMDSDFDSEDDDAYSFVDQPRTQEVTSSSTLHITEEPMSPHQNGLQERYGEALTQVDEERSTNAKLKQKIVDLTQNLTQREEEIAKVGILEEKVKELSQEASIARAEAQQAKRDEDQALTKLCRTVVGKDNLIDELRQKLTEKDRLILTLQETDTLEL